MDIFKGGKMFFPAFFVGVNDIQKCAAGGKSKKGDADDHERQMVPLTDGKNPDKEDFKRQG